MPDFSIEELQQQILELQEKLNTQTSELETQKEKLSKVEKERDDAREVNSKLWKGIKFKEDETPEEEIHKETPEEFIDSFVKEAVESIKRRTGDTDIGYHN